MGVVITVRSPVLNICCQTCQAYSFTTSFFIHTLSMPCDALVQGVSRHAFRAPFICSRWLCDSPLRRLDHGGVTSDWTVDPAFPFSEGRRSCGRQNRPQDLTNLRSEKGRGPNQRSQKVFHIHGHGNRGFPDSSRLKDMIGSIVFS
jgi:hypothetical protein